MSESWLGLQNSDEALLARSASDCLWTRVQQIRAIQLTVIVLFPASLAVIAQWYPSAASLASLIGFATTIFDAACLVPQAKRYREEAAHAQRLVDDVALSLPRPGCRRPADIDPTDLRVLALKQSRARIDRNRDWYTAALGRLPLSVGRIACMREASAWDENLRSRWATSVLASAYIIGVIFTLVSWYEHLTLESFLLRVLFPLTPLYVWAIREYQSQRAAGNTIGILRRDLRDVWEKGVLGALDDQSLFAYALEYNAALFDYRRSTFPVPDVMYRMLRYFQARAAGETADDFLHQYDSTHRHTGDRPASLFRTISELSDIP